MAQKPHKARKSPAQVRAGQRFAAAGRSAQARTRAAAIAKTGKPPPRTKAQVRASRQWASAGRAAQKARRAGLTPKTPKRAAAPILNLTGSLNKPASGLRPTGLPVLHELPACAPVALAEHLAFFTGIIASDEEILALHQALGAVSLDGLLEAVTMTGFAGARLDTWTRCDPDRVTAGMICGLPVRTGYHAVLAYPAGMLSWGAVLRWPGTPAEAWHLEWGTGDRAAW